MPSGERSSNTTEISNGSKTPYYLEQYRRCYHTFLTLHNSLWQVPTSTLLATITIVSLALQYLTDPLAKGATFLLTAGFIFLMLVQMAAHRRGIDSMYHFLKYLEVSVFQIRPVPFETTEIIEFLEDKLRSKDLIYNRFLIKQRSYFYFQYGLLITLILLIITGIYFLLYSYLRFDPLA
jgi:hypothetical protein